MFNNAVAVTSVRRSLELIDRWEILDFGVYFTLAMAALVIWKHRENVQRLFAGNEHRFEKAMVWRRWLTH